MSWYPIAFLPPQIEDSNGAPYSGAVLKAYAAGTSTSIAMATDYTGGTTAASFTLNASGYPSYGGNVIIPHLSQNYKLALYPNQAAADANSGAIWNPDNIQIADATNTSFIQYFDGNGSTSTFTLSTDFGTDENALMVFADRAVQSYASNTDFATDTIWTKGAGWTIAAGVATATGAISTAISQTATTPIVQGQSYTVEFTVTASAGTLTPSVGGNAGTTRGAGTWRETIIAGSTQTLAFTGVAFTGTLDAATIKDVYARSRVINRPDEYTVVGNQLTLTNVPPSGTSNIIVFAPSQLLGAANNAAAAAATSEANALTYKNAAATSASNAATSETNAAASASTAASYVAYLSGTSTTSLTIGTGSQAFTTQSGKQWILGQRLRAASDDGAKVMDGEVTAYSGTSLTIDVDYTEGSGSHADWNISLIGPQGPTGATGAPGGSTTFSDSLFRVQDNADATKQIAFEASGITTGTTRTFTAPNVSGTLITTGDTATVTNAMSAVMAANTVKVNATAGSASPSDVALSTNQVLGRLSGNIVAIDIGTTANDLVQLDGSAKLPAVDGSQLTNLPTPSSGALIYLGTQTASASATLDFTSLITSTYDVYVFECIDLRPATDNVDLQIRTSTNNGSSYDATGVYSYRSIYATAEAGTAETVSGGATETQILIGRNVGNAADEGLCGTLKLYNPLGTTRKKSVIFEGVGNDATGVQTMYKAYGTREATADIDAIRFMFSSGNITSGKIIMYGIKNS